eukprot:4537773-Amphidinium_carterae.1
MVAPCHMWCSRCPSDLFRVTIKRWRQLVPFAVRNDVGAVCSCVATLAGHVSDDELYEEEE